MKILPQMGLTPAMVPAELRLQIYEKLVISPGSSGAEKTKYEDSKAPSLKDQKTLKKIEDKKARKR